MIDKFVVVLNQVVRHIADNLPHALFLRFRFGNQVVVEPVEKVVAVEFVGTRVALPIPFSIRTDGPPGMDDFPQCVRVRASLRVRFDRVRWFLVGVARPVGWQHGPRRESFRGGVAAALRNLAEETQRLERCRGASLGLRILGGGIRKALGSAVLTRPLPIVVIVALVPLALIAGLLQADGEHESIGCTAMVPVDFRLRRRRPSAPGSSGVVR